MPLKWQDWEWIFHFLLVRAPFVWPSWCLGNLKGEYSWLSSWHFPQAEETEQPQVLWWPDCVLVILEDDVYGRGEERRQEAGFVNRWIPKISGAVLLPVPGTLPSSSHIIWIPAPWTAGCPLPLQDIGIMGPQLVALVSVGDTIKRRRRRRRCGLKGGWVGQVMRILKAQTWPPHNLCIFKNCTCTPYIYTNTIKIKAHQVLLSGVAWSMPPEVSKDDGKRHSLECLLHSCAKDLTPHAFQSIPSPFWGSHGIAG